MNKIDINFSINNKEQLMIMIDMLLFKKNNNLSQNIINQIMDQLNSEELDKLDEFEIRKLMNVGSWKQEKIEKLLLTYLRKAEYDNTFAEKINYARKYYQDINLLLKKINFKKINSFSEFINLNKLLDNTKIDKTLFENYLYFEKIHKNLNQRSRYIEPYLNEVLKEFNQYLDKKNFKRKISVGQIERELFKIFKNILRHDYHDLQVEVEQLASFLDFIFSSKRWLETKENKEKFRIFGKEVILMNGNKLNTINQENITMEEFIKVLQKFKKENVKEAIKISKCQDVELITSWLIENELSDINRNQNFKI